ncbi:PREDICTED: FGGY carbohydrate kinase domain-containing protein [Papilio xuthus]|uniref:FGGY carbohydrate kinase domain-containing protein n=1 Tax=Papilio xuthus TaxID=66420 RepID=A0AAJ6ZWM8_PAPXU|nr:PREDICTED: FGGY carbohydrate kinase domain-containing protein [Papilio xuthus]XP_013180625.1 PREDICTED: FGGY carbohydrate kinase domain-containing protein [Papilio xuthus]XP_013180626.1 PREDICTED: FGGY carbohydrate kinase domain-containing protein [Papilio xuthus]XP_013180627.1 PREDICTED: FGGY carbohydrate kinase domain-containing protein [Papilio xuthus]XP_013180628.1 PREDICTED: FGGY carbohydrate kinase domain-containing protein [Papilio xuthus]
MNTQSFFIGVDVGSGSARAALVDQDGHILRTSVKELRIWKPQPDFYEQSSNDIWSCCEFVIKEVIRNVNPEDIKGIGFDATCSLVAMDRNGNPLAVSNSHNNEQNVIMWMDHRAQTEAELINKTGHEMLKYVGGKVSLEMEMPKLKWLKKNLPNKWSDFGYFFDLPDYLTWKATGSESRSLCSLVCKWNYECSIDGKKGWNQDFLQNIGLDDLAAFDFKKIGSKVLMPGEKCGGLKNDVARSLGLIPGTPVATSIIDAHAGGLGMIGTNGEGIAKEMSSRLSIICGTSTCHMAVNKKPVLVPGIWGPYFSAMVPNLWLNEAGQSASGMLLDYVISSHPAGIQLLNKYSTGEVRTHLRQLLSKMTKEKGLSDVSLLSKDFHIWPDYHGNRSPLADPSMKGMICGLTINNSEENLALLYLATLQALSYGTRHIIEALVEAGYEPFKSLLICGGLSKDPLFVQIQADVVALPVLKPYESESVLLGSAILGACASQYFNNVQVAIETMGGKADVVPPNLNTKSFHDKKYKVFLKMYEDQLKYRAIMN